MKIGEGHQDLAVGIVGQDDGAFIMAAQQDVDDGRFDVPDSVVDAFEFKYQTAVPE